MLQPFNSICTHKEHTEFVILDIEPVLKDGVPVVVGKVCKPLHDLLGRPPLFCVCVSFRLDY